MGKVPFLWKHFLHICFHWEILQEGLLTSGGLSSKILKGVLLRCQLQGTQSVIDTIQSYDAHFGYIF